MHLLARLVLFLLSLLVVLALLMLLFLNLLAVLARLNVAFVADAAWFAGGYMHTRVCAGARCAY